MSLGIAELSRSMATEHPKGHSFNQYSRERHSEYREIPYWYTFMYSSCSRR